MKRTTLPLFTLFAALSLTLSAHAATLDFTDTTLGTGGTVTGYIDISGGAVTGSDITVSLNNKTYTFTGDGTATNGILTYSESFTSGFASLDLIFQVASLAGYNGGDLCSLANECQTVIPMVDVESSFKADLLAPPIALATGSLTPAPEPSSLILLGTGALGMVGAARRRFFHA